MIFQRLSSHFNTGLSRNLSPHEKWKQAFFCNKKMAFSRSEVIQPVLDNFSKVNRGDNYQILLRDDFNCSSGDDSQLSNVLSEINKYRAFSVNNSGGHVFFTKSTVISEFGQMDVQDIIALTSFLRVSLLSSVNAILKKEMERVTSVQSVIRDNRVDLYQKQIVKSIEGESKVKASNVFSLLIDWIVGVAEAVYGCVKFLGSFASGDLVGAASSAAYVVAGMSGIIKSVAETVNLATNDSKACQEIISISNQAQMITEGIAVAIDLFQAGKLAIVARASIKEGAKGITEASTKVLSELLDSAGESVAHDVGIDVDVIKSISHQIADEITEEICQNITNRLAHGEVEVMEMTELASSGERASVDAMQKVERNEILYSKARREMTKKLGAKIGDPNRLYRIIKESVTDAIKIAVKDSAGGIDSSVKKTIEIIQSEINENIIKSIIYDYFSSSVQMLMRSLPVAKGIVSGVVDCEIADVNSEVGKLILSQDFETFSINWLERQSKERELSRIKRGVEEIAEAFSQLNDVKKSNSLLSINIVTSVV